MSGAAKATEMALEEALGEVVAHERREWRREREEIAAEARAVIADFKRGKDGSLPEGLRGALGMVVAEQRREWERAREAIEAEARVVIAELKAGSAEWRAAASAAVAKGTHPQTVLNGKLCDEALKQMADSFERTVVHFNGVAQKALDDFRASARTIGAFPVIQGWTARLHNEGEIVRHAGGTWQAARSTAGEPPHEDWNCLAAPGPDGRSFAVRGTWSEAGVYRALDVVALNGASFAARHDNPGPCPGDGWQMIARQGQQAKPGVSRLALGDDGVLTLRNGDGSTVKCDLAPLVAKLTRGAA